MVGSGEDGIGDVVQPFGEGELVRLDLQVHAIGGIFGPIEALQDVERDQDDQSLRNRRLLHDAPVHFPEGRQKASTLEVGAAQRTAKIWASTPSGFRGMPPLAGPY